MKILDNTIFTKFKGNKDCPKCHGEGSYYYDDMHGKVCELCCKHPKGFEIPDPNFYSDQTPTCFVCGLNEIEFNQLRLEVKKKMGEK